MFLLRDTLEIKKIPNTKMATVNGVFAKKDIEGGAVIGDYLGKIYHNDDLDEHKYGTYYMTYSNETAIYADPKDPGVHMINHSCMPNCGMVEHDTHILYYALRKIFKGEELTVKYDLGIPDESCNPCTHQCYCGTPLCTGVTHSSEDDEDTYLDEIEDEELVKVGEMLQPLKTYPKKIRDAAIDNIYASLRREITIDDKTYPTLKSIRKRIRESGKVLYSPTFNLQFYGVHHNFILSKIKKSRSI